MPELVSWCILTDIDFGILGLLNLKTFSKMGRFHESKEIINFVICLSIGFMSCMNQL